MISRLQHANCGQLKNPGSGYQNAHLTPFRWYNLNTLPFHLYTTIFMLTDQKELQPNPSQSSNEVHLPTWREMNLDTSPETEAVLFKLWRETPAWRKLELLEDLNHTARQLALAGLRRRFPGASSEKLRRRLADLLLGEELAAEVFGAILD